jgi:hypothetical protein
MRFAMWQVHCLQDREESLSQRHLTAMILKTAETILKQIIPIAFCAGSGCLARWMFP